RVCGGDRGNKRLVLRWDGRIVVPIFLQRGWLRFYAARRLGAGASGPFFAFVTLVCGKYTSFSTRIFPSCSMPSTVTLMLSLLFGLLEHCLRQFVAFSVERIPLAVGVDAVAAFDALLHQSALSGVLRGGFLCDVPGVFRSD